MSKKNKYICLLMIATLLSVPCLRASAYDMATAQTYLAAQKPSPWVTMALTTTGSDAGNTDYLKNVSGTKALDYEAPILAIAALGQDPSSFGSVDYVAKLGGYLNSGQIGDPGLLNDDYFGVLALTSAGVPASDSVVSSSKNFIVSHQNPDGGWSYSASGTSDSNDTAAAIMALIAAGVPSSSSSIQNAISYLKNTQQNDGGFTYDPHSPYGTDSDSSSTSWVMWALTAAGLDSNSWTQGTNTPSSYLSGNQVDSGYFQFQPGTGQDVFSPDTTSYAVIALAGKTLPLKPGASGTTGSGIVAGLMPFFTTINPDNGLVGHDYNNTIQAISDYTMSYSLSSGDLPSGLSMDNAGNISGTPDKAGSYTFYVRVQNKLGYSASHPFTLNIREPAVPPKPQGEVAGATIFVGLAMPPGFPASGN